MFHRKPQPENLAGFEFLDAMFDEGNGLEEEDLTPLRYETEKPKSSGRHDGRPTFLGSLAIVLAIAAAAGTADYALLEHLPGPRLHPPHLVSFVETVEHSMQQGSAPFRPDERHP